MRSNRTLITLDSLVDIVMGQSPSGETCNSLGHGIPLLNGPSEFKSCCPRPIQFTTEPKKKAQQGDLLFCVRGSTTGRMNWADQNYAIGRGLAALRHKNGAKYQPFLRALMECILPALLNSATGSIFPNISREQLSKIKIYIPALNQQLLIANILGPLTEKIELNNNINAKLEALAKMLYDYWFVQFDFPDENGNPYKSSCGKMIYNSTLKREIPLEWKDSNILAVADLLGGGTPIKKTSEYWNGKIPFFTPSDADGNIFKLTTEDYITEDGLKNSSTKLFDKNTIFITARGSVGKLVLAGTKMAMNQSCYALRAKKDINYTYLFFLSKELIHHLEVKSSGSVFDSIVSSDIEFTNLAVPDLALVKKFADIVEPQFELIFNNIRENQQLSQLRDWLLPLLMNGQISVV